MSPDNRTTGTWWDTPPQRGRRPFGRREENTAPLRREAGDSGNAGRAARRACVALLAFSLLGFIAFPAPANHAIGHSPESALSPTAPYTFDTLDALGVDAGAPGDSSGFLDPDAAFVLSAEAREPHAIVLRWTLADTYYLLRDRFGFTLSPSPLELHEPRLPRGTRKQDPYFGETEVYYRGVEIVLPVKRRDREATVARLEVRYQGCTDRGLCYPPMRKSVTLVLPAVR